MTTPDADYRMLPTCVVCPSKTNPRLAMDPVALDGLCESIKSVGLQNPILVRPDADGYEIVAGHRRFAAFDKLGYEEIPAIVSEMSDEECREVQLIDNLQRADLDPGEECKGYVSLRSHLGTAAAIAQRIGKTVAHVTRVLQLENLGLFGAQALSQKLIGFDHALLIAKLGFEEQDRALKYLFDPYGYNRKKSVEERIAERLAARDDEESGPDTWEPPSPAKLREWIATHIALELKDAPWPLDDAALVPAAGACTSCPKNTAANGALFGDLAIESATCTDAQCYGDKREAFIEVQLQACLSAQAGHGAVRITWADSDKKPKWLKDGSGPKPGQVFKHGQWVESKAGCDHTIQAVAVDYDRSYRRDAEKKPGVVLRVCVAGGCKRHPKAWEQSKPKAVRGYDEKAEQEKRAKKAEACKAENVLRMKLANQALDKVAKLPDAVIREAFERMAPWDFKKRCPRWAKALQSSPLSGREFAEAAASVWLDQHGLEVNDSGFNGPERDRKEFQAALKLLGYDASRAWDKPSPKSASGKEVADEVNQSGRKGAAVKTKSRSASKKAPKKKAPAKKAAAAKRAPKKGARK